MAIYHYHRSIGKRAQGKNAVFAVAYIRGEKRTCYRTNETKDFNCKHEVVFKECILPEDAPLWARKIRNSHIQVEGGKAEFDQSGFTFSEYAWNQLEMMEKRKDAQLYFHDDLSIPIEFNQEQAIELVRDFVKTRLAVDGKFCDIAIHWDLVNPHAHIVMPLRQLTDEGFSNKIRFTKQSLSLEVKNIREGWAIDANNKLKELGIDARIDHRSFKEQGIALEPTLKVGKAHYMNDSHIQEMRLAKNEIIRAANSEAIARDPEILTAKLASEHQMVTPEQVQNELNKYAVNQQVLDKLASEDALSLEAKVDRVIDELKAQDAIFSERALRKMALEQTDNKADFNDLVRRVCKSKQLIPLGLGVDGREHYATRDAFNLELDVSRTTAQLFGKGGFLVSDVMLAQTAKKYDLNLSQNVALQHICHSTRLSIVTGYAGVGKTYMLNAAREVWEQGGFRVYGIAFSGRAAESLEEGAKIHSGTIAKFLKQVSEGQIRLNSQSIIVMDEAGMTSLDDMAAVLKVVKASGAKLAAVGDTEQTQSVGRGAPLRAMLSEVGSIKMDTILRQSGWQHDATLLMEQCKTGEGLDLYHQHGHVSLLDNTESACNTLIDKWQARLEKTGDGTLNKQILIAHRNESVAQLNHMARERLIALGKLADNGVEVNARNGKLNISVGERLLFEANHHHIGVKNGSFGTVTGIDGDCLSVQLDNGKQVQFSTQSYRDINYGYATTVHKLQGATVDYAFEYIDGPTWDRHLFLVGSSRHKLGLEIVADKATFGNYSALREVVSRHGLKDYLLEYPSHFALRRGFDEASTSSLAVRAIRGAKDKVTDSLLWLTNYEAYLDRKAAKSVDYNVVPADRLAAKLVADFADNRLAIGQQVEAVKALRETDDAISARTELQKSIYQKQLANSQLATQIWENKDGLRIALDRNRVTSKSIEDSIAFGVRHDQIKGMADAYRLGQLYDPKGANQVLTDFKQYYGHIVAHFGDRHDKSSFITTVKQQAYAYRFDQAMQSMGEARHADIKQVKQYLDLDCEVSLALAEKAQDPLSKQRLYEMSVSRNALANEIIGAQARQADVISHFDVDLARMHKHQQSHMARLEIERFASLIDQETSPGIARERELLAHRIRTEPKLYGPYVNEFLPEGFKQINLDNWRYKQRIALATATPQFKESYRLVRAYFDAARLAKDAWQNAIVKTRAQSVNASTARLKAQGLSAHRDKLASQLVNDMDKHAGALGFDKVDLSKLSQRARHHDYIDRYSHEQNAQIRLRMAHHVNQNLKGFGAQVHSRGLMVQVKREAHHYDYLKQVKSAPDQAIREIIRLNARYQQKAQQSASSWRSLKTVKPVDQNSHGTHMAKHLMSQRNEAAQQLMSALKQHDLVNAPIAGIHLDMKRLEKAANQYQGQLLVTNYLRADKANRGKLAYDILQNRSSYHFIFDKGLSFKDLQSDAHQYLTRAQEKGQQIKPITPRWDAEVVSHALRANSEQVYLSLFGEPKKRTSKEWRYDNGLIVTMRGTQAGNWYAFSEGVGGDPIKAIERIEGLSFKDALARGAQMAGLSEFEAQQISYQRAQAITPKQSDEHRISDQQRKHAAQSIWDSCILATGTLTERYFKEHRGLHHIEGMQIRHLPVGAKWVDYDDHGKAIDKVSKVPASVIALYNAQGEVTGVQRIFLDKETANKATFMDKPKLSKGIVTGSAGIIQEGKLAGRVYLAEGPETGASIALADTDATVLVSMGVHNLKNLSDVIKSYSPKEVVLAGDYDGKDAATRQTTEQAFSDLKEQLPDVACSVIYPEPIAGMKKVDFNDVLKESGLAALRNNLLGISISPDRANDHNPMSLSAALRQEMVLYTQMKQEAQTLDFDDPKAQALRKELYSKAAHIGAAYKGELSQFTELANNMAFEDVGFAATSRQAILSGDFSESHVINAAHAIDIDARHHDKDQSIEKSLEQKLQKDQDRDIDI